MKKEIEIYELIELYLRGKLSGDECTEFERSLASNPDLAELLESHRKIISFVAEGSLQEVKDDLSKIHRRRLGVRKRIRFISSISLFVLMSLGVLLLVRNHKSVDAENELPESDSSYVDEPIIKLPAGNSPSLSPLHEKTISPENNTVVERSVKKETSDSVRIPINANNSSVTDTSALGAVNEKTMILSVDSAKAKEIAPAKANTGEIGMSETTKTRFNCEDVHLSANVITTESCEERPTGSLKIEDGSIEQGEPPYSISIDNGKTFRSTLSVLKLYSGYYHVWLLDGRNCKSDLGSIQIESRTCDYDEVFAPGKGERWEVNSDGKQAVLQIFDQQGVMVFRTAIEEGEKYYWNGTSLQGNALPMGIYSFMIEFNSGELKMGSITIVR